MPRRTTRETTLRDIWQHQAFNRLPLLTDEGISVAVRFPGTPNADGGPDFTDARIRIGSVLARGDVELHAQSASWHAHGHDADPHYNRVILHAVLRPGRRTHAPRTASGRAVPQVVLSGHVDLRRLPARPRRPGEICLASGARVSPLLLHRKLRRLGKRKIAARVRALALRLDQIMSEATVNPWGQLLYECLMEGMGYSKNRRPFLALARSLPIARVAAAAGGDAHAAEALLFGEAGLLPPSRSISDKESRGYVRCQRRRWRSLRGEPRGTLCEADWLFFRMRPANFPTARLAGLCRLIPLIAGEGALERVLAPLERPEATPGAALREIRNLFAVRAAGFWSRHVHFRARGGRVRIGRERIHDLVFNAVVPLALLRARREGDTALARRALALLEAMPGGFLPSALADMERRLGRATLAGRLAREGALRLRARYCLRLLCGRCPALRRSRRRSPGRTWSSRRP
ncbi:MAG TPA: DUF2851 family protein [Bacteroidota bacterium]|nr:DUF2851 family protein [Bacteroidota bacterium]